MPLNVTQIRNAKPTDKIQRLYDERGLYLELSPKGGMWWRFKYRFNNKEKRISLGTYPDVSLQQAREKRDEARKHVADGIDPSTHRQVIKQMVVERAANSFEVVAREWFAKHKSNWVDSHANKIIQRFQRDIFPWLGDTPIADITPPILLSVIRRIEARGSLDTAHRALNNCSQVFRYAVASGKTERDPSQDIKGALPPTKTKHFPTQTDPKRFGELLRMFNEYQGSLVVKSALCLAPLLFVRPGELRHAKWSGICFDKAEWSFITSKTETPIIVPLSSQALAILKELRPLTGHGVFVFPSARSYSRPMSDNAVLAALRRIGISKEEATGHGFRATARTLLDEVLGFRADIIEHQLGHAVRDPNGRAYNRTIFLEERKRMMQAWGDYLANLTTME
jgi:integrase